MHSFLSIVRFYSLSFGKTEATSLELICTPNFFQSLDCQTDSVLQVILLLKEWLKGSNEAIILLLCTQSSEHQLLVTRRRRISPSGKLVPIAWSSMVWLTKCTHTHTHFTGVAELSHLTEGALL